MKSVRVVLVVLALSALPLVAVAAQGNSDANKCKNSPAASSTATAQRVGVPSAPGQVKKCPPPAPVPPPPVNPPAPVPPPPVNPPAPVPPPPPPPPPAEPPPAPPPSQPPTGLNEVRGVVFEDLDGNGVQDVFGGEMGIAGWTLQLWWNGQLLTTSTSDADGLFVFAGLGKTTYSVCQVQGGVAGVYTQTAPTGAMAAAADCPGAGYPAAFTNDFATWYPANFGMMPQP